MFKIHATVCPILALLPMRHLFSERYDRDYFVGWFCRSPQPSMGPMIFWLHLLREDLPEFIRPGKCDEAMACWHTLLPELSILQSMPMLLSKPTKQSGCPAAATDFSPPVKLASLGARCAPHKGPHEADLVHGASPTSYSGEIRPSGISTSQLVDGRCRNHEPNLRCAAQSST